MASNTRPSIPLISSSVFRPYLDLAADIVSTQAVMKAVQAADLQPKTLDDCPVFIPYRIQASIAEHLSRSTGLEHFGLLLSSQVPYQSISPYADYVLAAEDLLQAIEQGIDTFPCIIQGASIHLSIFSGTVFLGFDSRLGNAIGRSHVDEGFTAALINLVKLYTNPDWMPDAVRLINVGKRRRDKLEEIYGTKVISSDALVGIDFPAYILKNRIRDSSLKRNFVTREDVESCVVKDVSSFKDLVRNLILLELVEGNVSLEAVSRRLGIGTRTLQRRLMLEAETFQSCLDWTRRERAIQLLKQTGLSIDSISQHLGFAEPNSFRRAFRKWHNMSVMQYRQVFGLKKTLAD